MKSQRWYIVPFVLVALFSAAGSVSAQPIERSETTVGSDTITQRERNVVVVTAQSMVDRIARRTQPLAVISRAEVVAAGGSDLSDALALVPGVFIRGYGGLGGLRTLSLRGTSAQQTVVLIDGVRYQGSASGSLDLSNIPLESFERAEVVRGGGTTIYGANALGGVVNIITRPPTDVPLRADLSLALGSYGEARGALDLSGSSATEAWNIGGSVVGSQGDYPFLFNEFGETSVVRRDNGDFTNIAAHAGWRRRDSSRSDYGVTAQGFLSERGTPGAVVQGSREQSHARLNEREIFTVARLGFEQDDWHLGFSTSIKLNRLRYRDPDARVNGPNGIDNSYNRRELAVAGRARTIIGDGGIVDIILDLSDEYLDGNNLDPSVGNSVTRRGGGVALAGSWNFEDGLFGCETLIEGGLRGDLYTGIDPAISPSLGFLWSAGDLPIRLRARGALGYRAPSFTEQYYLNYGNRDLRPEHSVSVDVGATAELDEAFVLEATAFRIDTRDQIVTVPRSPVSWSATNAARVRTDGIELAGSGTLLDGLLRLRGSYTLSESLDFGESPAGERLPYAPQELFNGTATVMFGDIGATATWSYVSHRYALKNEEPSSILPHYAIAGCGLSWRIVFGSAALKIRTECLNIFNIDYQVIRNYPMPGRTLRVAIDCSL